MLQLQLLQATLTTLAIACSPLDAGQIDGSIADLGTQKAKIKGRLWLWFVGRLCLEAMIRWRWVPSTRAEKTLVSHLSLCWCIAVRYVLYTLLIRCLESIQSGSRPVVECSDVFIQLCGVLHYWMAWHPWELLSVSTIAPTCSDVTSSYLICRLLLSFVKGCF